MWHIFEADSGDQVWRDVVSRLGSDPAIQSQPSRAGPTRELLHAALTVRDPRQRWVFSRRPAMNPAFAIAEVIWILAGRRDARFLTFFNHALQRHAGTANQFHGAYGYRLRHQFGFDQLEAAFQTLRNNPASRQVILQLWDPRDDLPNSSGLPRDADIPCNTQAILKVRDGRLEWLQIMRSNDVFLGLPHNLIQFTVLQEVIAGWLGLELGHYHHISDSLHLYERDLGLVSSCPPVSALTCDSLALPKAESDAAIRGLVGVVERIIDEGSTIASLVTLPDAVKLPAAYQNFLFVLVAEGLRRRNAQLEATAIMRGCSSKVFQTLWINWNERIVSNREAAARGSVAQ